MKKLLTIILIFTIAICNIMADTFHYDPHSKLRIPHNETNTTAVSVTEDSLGITISYSLGSLHCRESENLKGWYSVALDGFGAKETEGLPDVPFRVDQFSLPEDVDSVVLSVCDFSSTDIRLNIIGKNAPVLSDQCDISVVDKPASVGMSCNVDSIIGIHDFGHRKDVPIVFIEISPLQYDIDTGTLHIYKDFTYRIDYVKNPNKSAKIPTSTIEHPSNLWSRTYLLISQPMFRPEIKEFVDWKKQMGFNVIEVYRDKWIHETVKHTIDSIYEGNHDLQYVLLVGDNNIVPAVPNIFRCRFTSDVDDSGRKYVSDFPYSCIDGDSIADINIGRIPAWSKDKVKNAFNKILRYEKNPSTDPRAYDIAMHTAIFDTKADNPTKSIDPCVHTARTIRDYVIQQGINCLENYSASEHTNPALWYSNGDSIHLM